MQKKIAKIAAICFLGVTWFLNSTAAEKPNVILILTDDQGIGDLASLGNPWINTPNLDKFSEMAVRND